MRTPDAARSAVLPPHAQGSTLNLRILGAVQLTKAYRRYLRKRDGLAPATLRAAGYGLEAALLEHRPLPEPWTKHRTHVGPRLPDHARPGDIWMDTVEVMPMVLIPFEDTDEPILWLAMRPVARWQFAAAGFGSARALDGPELAPVTRVSYEEATRYAQWFGKLTADRIDWQLAKAALPRANVDALWGSVREWGSYEYEEVYSVVEPSTVDLEDVPDELIFYPSDAVEDVGFRTSVHLQIGMIKRRLQARR
jgi:hypothetical protein